MTSGGQGGNVFQEVWPGVGFETDDFVKEMLGGATIGRLWGIASGRTTPTPMTPACGEELTCSSRPFLPSAISFAILRIGRQTPPLRLKWFLNDGAP